MKKIIPLLLLAALASCAPVNHLANKPPMPVLIKVSPSAKVGEVMTIQGRYLGSREQTQLLLTTQQNIKEGFRIPDEAIVSWTDTDITLRVPQGVPARGLWLSVLIDGEIATSLPVSIVGQ